MYLYSNTALEYTLRTGAKQDVSGLVSVKVGYQGTHRIPSFMQFGGASDLNCIM